MTRAKEDDDLRARIARDLENENPNTELAPPMRSAEVEALLAQDGDILEQAVRLAQAGQREDALQVVSQILEDDPSLLNAWLLMAALADNALIAQACLEQALLLDPDYEPVRTGLDWMSDHPDQVPTHLIGAPTAPAVSPVQEVTLPAEEPDLIEQALTLVRAGQGQEALGVLTNALEHDPSSARGWVLLSTLADNAVEAQTCLEQALTVEPDYAPAQDGLDWMRDHPDQVPAHLVDALAPAAAPPEVPVVLEEAPPEIPVAAVAVPSLEEEDDLRARIARDLEREEPDTELAPPPPSAEVAALLAEGGDPVEQALALAQAGRNEDALQVLSPALEADPSLVAGWTLMGALADNALVAQMCLEQALTVEPDYAPAQDGLDWMHDHPDQVPAHLVDALTPAAAPPEVPVVPEEAPPEIPVAAVAVPSLEEDDLRARIARDLEREGPDTELAPPPPSAEVAALLAEGGDPVEQALALARMGRNEDALQVLSPALEADPSLVAGWALMGALADNALVAQVCLEQALTVEPDYAPAQDGLDWMRDHPDQVPAHLVDALAPAAAPPEVPVVLEEAPPEIPVAAVAAPPLEEEDDLRARIARDLEREEPDTELAPPPPSAEVTALLAEGGDPVEQALALAQAGRNEDALQVLSSALEADPSLVAGWTLMGALADNALVAQMCLEQALTVEPDCAPAQDGLDWMRGHPDQVPVHLVDALAPAAAPPTVVTRPAEEPDLIEQALTLVRAGQGQEALEVLTNALEHDPSSARGWVLLSTLADNAVEAQACLEQALTVEPGYAPAQDGLDWMRDHPDQVPVHLVDALAPAAAPPEVPVVLEEAPPEIPVAAVAAPPLEEEDDLRARIARDLEREEPDTELAPPPPSAEVAALLAEGGDPVEQVLDLARMGRNEDALQVLSKVLEDDPSSVRAWVLMGALADNAVVARSCLEQAMLLDPDDPEALDGLRWMDRHPDEVPAFILGEAQPPKSPTDRALVDAAKALARRLEEQLAVSEKKEEDDLRARIARDLEREEPDTELAPPPPSAEVAALLAEGGEPLEQAVALAQAGRNADALQVLSKVLEEDSESVRAWVLMGALADNAVVARSCLEQAMLLDPDDPEALDGLRWMDQHPDQVPAFILGEARPKAPPAEPRPAPSRPKEAEDLVAWAVAAIEEEKFEDAHAYLGRAVELDPQNETAWLQLASVAETPEESRGYLDRVLEINPHSREALDRLQWLEQGGMPGSPFEVAVPPEPAEAAYRPLITSIAPAGLPKDQPTPLPVTIPETPPPPPRVSTRPALQYTPSRRLEQLLRGQTPASSSEYPFEQPEEPFPQRRGCRVLTLLALAFLAAALVLGGMSVGLTNAAGLLRVPEILTTPTVTLTREEKLTRLWGQSEIALEQGEWDTAVRLLREVQTLDPDRVGLADRRYQAHLSYGLALVADDQIEAAIAQFDEALAIQPGDEQATMQRRLAGLYLEGRDRFAAGDWGTAVAKFAEVHFLSPAYRSVATFLYMARCRFGNALLASGNLDAAIEQYDLALQLIPQGEDATKGLKHARVLMPTPTPIPLPTPTPVPRQRIEISISQQRFRAYQDDALAFDLVCSTGEPARPTKPGNFRVLDKIPMAYSSVWNLKMPWWLGIYWSGSIENGIHALPILSSGRTLWAGLLGRPVSFGCIILDTPDAKRVYDWAQIGTPVTITR